MSEQKSETRKAQLKRGDSEQDEEQGMRGGPDVGLEAMETPSHGIQEERDQAKKLRMASRGAPPLQPSGIPEERERKANAKNLRLASRGAPPPRPEDHEDADKISGKPPLATSNQDYSDDDSTEMARTLGLPSPPSFQHRGQSGYPGAYRIRGFAPADDDNDEATASPSVDHSPLDANATPNEQRDALVLAELVSQPALAQAVPLQWWKRHHVAYASVILLILVAVLVGVLVGLLSGEKSEQSNDNSPSEIPERWTQLGQAIDGEAPGDLSGYLQSVSLSYDGTTVAVGAMFNGGNGAYSGSVRAFQLREGHWNQIGQDIDGESWYDQSGSSIDLSTDGRMLAIGAPTNYGNGPNSGHVRVFQLVNGFWYQVGTDLEGTDAYDSFGVSVSLSADGRTLAVGADQFYSNEIQTGIGYTRVFHLEGGTWSQMGEDLTGEDFGDMFGFAVSLSYDGLTLAVTGPSNGDDSGYACIYNFVQDQWMQKGQCIYGQAAKEEMGFSLSLSAEGSILALGAPFGKCGSGLARVYEFVNNDWVKIGDDIETDSNGLGFSISLSSDGRVLAVGATRATQSSCEGTNAAGYAAMFRLEEGSWDQMGRQIDGKAAGDQFGHAISLAGDGFTVAVGAPFNDGNGDDSGRVQVYRLNDAPPISTQSSSPATPMPTTSMLLPGTWSQVGQDLNGEAPGDQSGELGALSLSEFGDVVAIGAPGNDDVGEDAGHVRVYQLTNGLWSQIGMGIDGDAPNDQSGGSVTLSSDGTTLAVGAAWADVNGTNAGRVCVYVLVNGSWTQIGQVIQGNATGDLFGVSVSMSSDGSTIAVGASQDDDSPGYCRVFHLEGATWTQMGQDLVGDASGESFGQALSLSADGSTLAIGAPGNHDYVRVYQLTEEGLWTQFGHDATGEVANDGFGKSLALSADGTILAVGGADNNSNGEKSGHVQVYRLDGGEWTLLGQEIEGKSAGDRFGASVSLSSNGTVLAVGADEQYDSGTVLAVGEDHYDDSGTLPTGYASIFRFEDKVWKQIGDDLVGKEGGDNFGSSISLSGNGRTVAVGAYNSSNANGESSGQVRIFYLVDD